MSILDSIIANHGSPRVVSENHDLGKIAVDQSSIDAGLRSLTGTWDTAEYGISAEEVERRIAAANTPEAREQMLAELRQRAIRRASLDTSNGRVNVMVVSGPNGEKSPWHQLGVQVASAVSSADAARLAGLDWKVLKLPAAWDFDGDRHESLDTFVLIRDDTGAQLGSTGPRYKPIQNGDGFDFLDSVLKEFGAKYETAGAVFGGKKVWMQAHLPQQSFTLLGNDVTEAFATFTLDHTGAGADRCYPTTLRAVCANTLRVANQDKGKGISIPHIGDTRGKINAARTALGLAVQEIGEFAGLADSMTRTPLSVEELGNVVLDSVIEFTQAQVRLGVDGILDTVLSVTQANRDAEAKRVEREIKKRDGILQDILDRYHTRRCEPKGSAWAAFNAVTESADYGKWGKDRQDDKSSRRLESILTGDRDDAKQVALQYVQQQMAN